MFDLSAKVILDAYANMETSDQVTPRKFCLGGAMAGAREVTVLAGT